MIFRRDQTLQTEVGPLSDRLAKFHEQVLIETRKQVERQSAQQNTQMDEDEK